MGLFEMMVRPKGLKPLASAFGGLRSIQLSYGRITMALQRGIEPLAYRLGGGRSIP